MPRPVVGRRRASARSSGSGSEKRSARERAAAEFVAHLRGPLENLYRNCITLRDMGAALDGLERAPPEAQAAIRADAEAAMLRGGPARRAHAIRTAQARIAAAAAGAGHE